MALAFKQRLFFAFPVLFCFCLPFGSYLLSVIIIAWSAVSLFNLNRSDFLAGIKRRETQIALLFFVLTVFSALLSQNKREAASAIEIKLSFFVFPYLLFCFRWPVEILKRSIVGFVSGCFFACVYLLIRAGIYAYNGQPDYFFYSLFSDFIHASYFSMYLVLAGSFVVVLYPKWFAAQKSIVNTSWVFLAVFLLCIFLCSSKLGLITLFIVGPMLIFRRFKVAITFRRVMLALLLTLAVGVVFALVFPKPFQRLSSITSFSYDKIDRTSSESTTVRVLIWEQCLSIIKHHFITGVGVGDANDSLYEAYEQNGLTGAYSHRFNAHSQYFQTFVGLGLVGFVLLATLTFGQLLRAVRKRQFFYTIFSLLIVLNFFVESMLQTAAGVLFFVFFSGLFNLLQKEDLLSD